jgi:hypothetical protein
VQNNWDLQKVRDLFAEAERLSGAGHKTVPERLAQLPHLRGAMKWLIEHAESHSGLRIEAQKLFEKAVKEYPEHKVGSKVMAPARYAVRDAKEFDTRVRKIRSILDGLQL